MCVGIVHLSLFIGILLAFLLSVAALARFRPGLSRPSTDGAGVARLFPSPSSPPPVFFFPKSNPRDAIFSDAVNSNGGRNFWLHRPGGWKADGRRMGGGWEADDWNWPPE